MRKILTLSFSILLSSAITSQIWEKSLLVEHPNANLEEKYEAFKKYRKKHPNVVGHKPYARNMEFIMQRKTSNSEFKQDQLYKEWLKDKMSKNTSNNSSNWIAKGPINTPIILSNGKKRGNGRINCIAFDPIDTNIIWVGSPSGGIWKSDDGGNSWSTNTDNLPVIGISHIAISPNNPQIMYVVTGDANGSDTYSIGILKSIDGGNSWDTTGLSYNILQQNRINKIIINPRYSDSLFVATNSNIMVSSDAGANWTSVGITGRWRDIEFKPLSPEVIYAAKQSNGGSNIYRSLDGGTTWQLINSGMATSGKDRPLLAVTSSNPNVVYALFSATDDSYHGIYKSIDAGDSWNLQSNSPNILGRSTDGISTGGQSWYNLSLGVSSVDENHIYVGGINLWESNDGGQNWDISASSGNGSNYSYMHVDQHALEFNPLNNSVYAGNDGGIYKWRNDLNRWLDISDGLEISQFYKLGVSQSNGNKIVAGAQDNGTEMLTNNVWDAIMGGDGMECAIDPYDENIIYAEFQYGGIRKSYNGGADWDNIKPVSYEGGWVTPYEIHPNNPLLIVAGYDEIYRSYLGGDISGSFNSWDSISYNVSGGQSVRFIGLAPSNQDYIYAGTYSRLKVTTNGGSSWENIKPGLPNFNMTDIAISSTDPDHIWVTFSEYNSAHKVYESFDRGQNWINITGNNLPNLPVNCIVNQPYSNGDLYIGTDIGVYYKNNDMVDWIPYMNGLPNVIVSELEIQNLEGTISAATYGRGVWKSNLNSTSTNIKNIGSGTFTLYPNPAKDSFIINFPNKNNYQVNIYTITGLLVKRFSFTKPNNRILTGDLSAGCYIIELTSEDEAQKKKLIIK